MRSTTTALPALLSDTRALLAAARADPGAVATRLATQWLWLLPGLRQRVGRGHGPRTWLEDARHASLVRPLHICLLEHPRARATFGRLMAAWINERSGLCTAAVNEGLERADVVWTFTQDPLSPATRRALGNAIARAPADAVVLNHPDRYDAYHEAGTFERLAAAGVGVPRSSFTAADVGRTEVVYKRLDQQHSEKHRAVYGGPLPGYRAFEFVDALDPDGLRRRYRSYLLAGHVRPSKVQLSPHWNVCLEHAVRTEETFTASDTEVRQIRKIAATLGLDYFAVDYLRRPADAQPVFVDINVYPRIFETAATNRGIGRHGLWHSFDTRAGLGLPEPDGVALAERFDAAMASFVSRKGRRAGDG